MIILRSDIPNRYKDSHFDKDIIWFTGYTSGIPIAYAGISIILGMPCFGPSFVFPAYRGMRLQRELINFRIDFCKTEGYTEVGIYVDIDNIPSLKNILACGFSEEYRHNEEIFLTRKI